MKTLYIVRHAEAGPAPSGLEDFERVLTKQGRKDAQEIGGRLLSKEVIPQTILSSAAFRTLTTSRIIAREAGFPAGQIRIEMQVYNANLQTLLRLISETNDYVDSLMIVGHNPGMHELANYLGSAPVNEFSPCMIVGFKIPSDLWKFPEKGMAEIIMHEYP